MEWFSTWFDSPYYHLLYKDRNDDEAHFFMNNLCTFLNIKKESSILDLACGKGRHSRFLSSQGYDVTGVDLSPASISYAKKGENATLRFDTHDMRALYKKNAFQYIFNLFTSFGYFDDDKDNQSALTSVAKGLTEDGVFVMDFLNPSYVIPNLVAKETKEVEGIVFELERKYTNGYITKDISFEDKGLKYNFQEKVQAIFFDDFAGYFQNAGLELVTTFGDYSLSEFDLKTSKRMIFVCKHLK